MAPDHQPSYWDRVADEKTFTFPFDLPRFRERVPLDASVIDVGCGYGRTLDELWRAGYRDLRGFDIAPQMLARGAREHPHLDLRAFEGGALPVDESSVGAALLITVLTCIPGNDAQRTLMRDVHRVLARGGILVVGDLWLQEDVRNRARYDASPFPDRPYGVFRHAEGAVLRHHDRDWIRTLLSQFEQVELRDVDMVTMNGNAAAAFWYVGAKAGA